MRDGLTTGQGTCVCANRRRGFTLVELVVVLSVMLLAAVVAVPSFLQFHRANQLRTAVMRTLALASEAHGLAVSRDAEVRLLYDAAVHGLRIAISGAGPGSSTGNTPLLEGASPDARLTDLPLDVRFEIDREGSRGPAAPEIEFYGDGTAAPVRILLSEDGIPPVALETNPRTGRLRIRTGPGAAP